MGCMKHKPDWRLSIIYACLKVNVHLTQHIGNRLSSPTSNTSDDSCLVQFKIERHLIDAANMRIVERRQSSSYIALRRRCSSIRVFQTRQ